MEVFFYIHVISLIIMIIISFVDKKIRQDRGSVGGTTPGTGSAPMQVAYLFFAFVPILNTIFALWYIHDNWVKKH